MKKELTDMLRIPQSWNEKISDKLSYATFTVETEESYNKESRATEDMRMKSTGYVTYECNHIPICKSVSIKVDVHNYERLVEEKYYELFSQYGDRLTKRIYLT